MSAFQFYLVEYQQFGCEISQLNFQVKKLQT